MNRWRSIAILFALACGRGDGAPSFVTRDSVGITIAESVQPAWAATQAWRVSEIPTVDIGVGEGEPPYELAGAWAAVKLDNGNIVIANSLVSEVRWFGADGSHLWTVGRRGGGPGEFSFIVWLSQFGRDSVIVYDNQRRRLTIFDEVGQVARTSVLQAGGLAGFESMLGASLYGVFGDGSLLAVGNIFNPEELSDGYVRLPDLAYRFSSHGTYIDSLGSYPGFEGLLRTERNRSGAFTDVELGRFPFGKSLSAVAAGDRFYVGTQETYEILVFDSTGSAIGLVRWPDGARRVTRDDIAAYAEDALAQIEDDNLKRDRRRELDGLRYPETMPAYGERLLVDPDQNLWVEEYQEPRDPEAAWTVFDATHRMLGSVAMIPEFTVFQIGRDFVLGRWEDELGVEHIRVYQLMKP